MAFQIYFLKKNFEVQKALRFFKERRIELQLLDLSKHKLGKREIELFIKHFGIEQLLDKKNPKVLEHPACYTNDMERIIEYIAAEPFLLSLPIIRSANKLLMGYDEKALLSIL